MQPALLILAAGMGSRYGNLKQLDAMGPNGETILEYSVHDAIQAGFGKVVFVIQPNFADVFKSAIGYQFQDKIEIAYAFQDLTDIPKDLSVPKGRKKPWGTAHGVWAAREEIEVPFAVINADDFYGRDAFVQLVQYFRNQHIEKSELRTCMVGYKLANTLSKNGTVNRGICRVKDGALQTVEEHREIGSCRDAAIYGKNLRDEKVELNRDAIVSMNFWGFTPAIFDIIEGQFTEFLKQAINEPESECYIPGIVDSLLQSNRISCAVLETSGSWFGITYPTDKSFVQTNIRKLIDNGEYPSRLGFFAL